MITTLKMGEVNDSLRNREQRLVYLVTYSRADVKKSCDKGSICRKDLTRVDGNDGC